MNQEKKLKIRPYARLLTMLGEQLIRNERIALIELIKNSYDADADWVKITFQNFGDNYVIKQNSKIIIEDNGCGMSQEIIEKQWMNPATPEKKKRKSIKDTTDKGRIIQGEKGIGRFAVLKLGRKIDIFSKTKFDEKEHHICYDFSSYDDEFLTENGEQKDLFIDDLNVVFLNRFPKTVIPLKMTLGSHLVDRLDHGTTIEISNLKGSWTENKVESVYRDLTKLQPIFFVKKKIDFEVGIYNNHVYQNLQENYLEGLNLLLNERSVIRITEGYFDSQKMEYKYCINSDNNIISIFDPSITGLKVFRDRFGNAGSELKKRDVECGSFKFGFYIFDLTSQALSKYQLDKKDKSIIKDHRIYLYRDGIRVYPYGEPDDDWLGIDVYRGTVSAGQFLSNDQVVGFVDISYKNNPKLKDKTNREGLIDEGNATEDFRTLIRCFLAYIRQKPYAHYRKDIENKKDHNIFIYEKISKRLADLRATLGNNKKATGILSKVESEYNSERLYLMRRAEITEELAGVGLSVETASHDIMGIMSKVSINLDGLIRDLISDNEIDKEQQLKELQSIRGGVSFIEAQLKDIQLLFKSSKQRRKIIKIETMVEKVERIYRRLLKKESVQLLINATGHPLSAKTTDAVLLQLLLNLFDNSVFWLQQTSRTDRKIEILLNGTRGQMIFSDNGPGISEDDVPYIFEPFYSGKGDEGRGLGLYIARQLLERHEYSIDLIMIESEKILSGANFVINFFRE